MKMGMKNGSLQNRVCRVTGLSRTTMYSWNFNKANVTRKNQELVGSKLTM